MNYTKDEREKAKGYLLDLVEKGDTIWAFYRHYIHSSGTAFIDFYVIKENRPLRLTYNMARVLESKWSKDRECIQVGFMNMDQAFELVYRLGHKLFDDGYALNKETI